MKLLILFLAIFSGQAFSLTVQNQTVCNTVKVPSASEAQISQIQTFISTRPALSNSAQTAQEGDWMTAVCSIECTIFLPDPLLYNLCFASCVNHLCKNTRARLKDRDLTDPVKTSDR